MGNDGRGFQSFAVVAFSVTMFLSAALLFLVEPMFAKMALPLLGGSAAVWTTCLVFFQACCWQGTRMRMLRRSGWEAQPNCRARGSAFGLWRCCRFMCPADGRRPRIPIL